MGYLSVVIASMSLVLLYRRQMLLCDECCGLPIYSNSSVVSCKQCDKPVTLKVNPRVLGVVIDETGSVGAGKMVLGETAWEELLGRSAADLAKMKLDEVNALEARMLWVRVTLCFVRVAEEDEGGMGRLWVWSVRA